MAVYTEVGFAEADRLVQALGLGALTDLRGITSGIENTNYFASTERAAAGAAAADGAAGAWVGAWVITLFERLPRAQLPYYLELMRHLAQHGIPVPAPQPDAAGKLVHTLVGKPAAVVTRLRGSHRLAPTADHCAQLGELLARMHRAAADFTHAQPHLRGLAWWHEVAPQVLPHLDADRAALLRDELAFQTELAQSAAGQALPRGHIHADLFRDNAMFEPLPGGDTLCGVFDFYFAGIDTLLFDVAVCLNDWCADDASGRIDDARASAFTAAYARVRPFESAERRLLPALLRAAGLRFWISRLWDWHLPRDAALLQPKDPAQFERVLRERRATPWYASA